MECSARNLDTWSRGREGEVRQNKIKGRGLSRRGDEHLVDVESWKTRQMQPAIQEHGAVARAEDEPVAVDPRGLIGIEDHGVAVQHRAELSASERQSKVAAGALVNGVHGQAARFIGCASKIDSRYGVRHIRRVVLGYTWRAAHFEDNRVAPGCCLHPAHVCCAWVGAALAHVSRQRQVRQVDAGVHGRVGRPPV